MKKSTKVFFILLIISFFLLFLDRFSGLSFLKSGFAYISNPLLSKSRGLHNSIKQLIDWDKRSCNYSDIPVNPKEMEKKIGLLEAELHALRTENLACQGLLQSPLPAEWDFVMAHSMGVNNGTLSINKGEKDGLSLGDPVLSDDILIGRVSQLFPKNAKIDLVFGQYIDFQAKVLPSGGEGKISYDDRLGQLFIREILNEHQLNTGETVVTTGRDGVFPPNMVIGKIAQVHKVEAELFQQAIIEPLLDTNLLDIVFIRI